MTQHTPGPWNVDNRHFGDINGPDGKDLAVCLFEGMNDLEVRGNAGLLVAMSRDQAEANARLIAAAPELLAACRLALDEAEQGMSLSHDEMAQLSAAIAKATGQ